MKSLENFKTKEEIDKEKIHIIKRLCEDLRKFEILAYIFSRNEFDNAREMAADELGELRDPRAVPCLIKALNDYNCNVRNHAARALAKLKDPRIIPNLLKQYGKEKEETAKCGIIYALGEKGDYSVVPVLIESLKNGSNGVRFNAVNSLGSIGDSKAVPYLLKALKDSHIPVRMSASEALKKCIDSSSKSILKKSILDDNDVVQRVAKECIQKLKIE